MSGILEQLIEALNANTAALNAAAANGSAPAATETKTTKTTGTKSTGTKKTTETKAGPKHTKAEASEVVVTVKDTLGVDEAKKLLGNHGFKKMADITEDKFDAIFEEGTAMLEAAKAGEEDTTDADDDI